MKSQVGQLLLIHVQKADWTPGLERLLLQFEPAGIWFHHLTPATAEVCRKCAGAAGSVPFLAVEEEGDGIMSDLFAHLPPWVRLDAEDAERAGEQIGRGMTILGLNLNLAPIVDLPGAATGAVAGNIRDTVVSQTLQPVEIARRADAFVRGLTRQRVLACARHFPGMLRTGKPQPASGPVVDRPMATIWREDLVPYRTLAAKPAIVQITHAVHKAYDYEFPRPASLSPTVVEGLLRVKLGYPGVALADASAAARAAGIDVAEAAVKAVAAGCDLVLVPGEQKQLHAVWNAFERAIELGGLTRDRIEEAVGRVKTAKKRIGRRVKDPSQHELERLRRSFADFRRELDRERQSA